jgi:hypothetical protein
MLGIIFGVLSIVVLGYIYSLNAVSIDTMKYVRMSNQRIADRYKAARKIK